MKTLKFSFAAIIAVLTVSLTIAAQAGAFESKKVLAETDCFIPTASAPLLQIKDPSCPALPITISSSTLCSAVDVNDAVWSVDELAFFNNTQVANTCTGGTRFCCFKLVSIAQADRICNQPLVDAGAATTKYYKVAQVFCRPQ